MRYKFIDPHKYTDEQVDELLATLPEWRREQALRFKHRQGRKECVLSYWLLSEMLGYMPDFAAPLNPPFRGKPYLAQPISLPMQGGEGGGTFFNLTHCKNAIGCVVSEEGEVGIDAECLGRYKPSLAEYCMSEEELRQINESDDPDAEFTLLWTRKEALLKLTGEGITDDMKTCLTSPRAEGVTTESGIDKENGYAWSVAQYSAQFTVHSSKFKVHSS